MEPADIPTAILTIIAIFLMATGIASIIMDLRHFPEIIKKCETRGYIQNNDVRINCQVVKDERRPTLSP